MKKIYLSGKNNHLFALVDDMDYEIISKMKWYLHEKGYAITNRHIRMHRLINQTPKGLQTDHKNGDKLDNRRSNLRSCNNSQNHYNIKLMANNTSGHKGISWNKIMHKWEVYINKDSRRTRLGFFSNKRNAIKTYREAAKELHGDFVRL